MAFTTPTDCNTSALFPTPESIYNEYREADRLCTERTRKENGKMDDLESRRERVRALMDSYPLISGKQVGQEPRPTESDNGEDAVRFALGKLWELIKANVDSIGDSGLQQAFRPALMELIACFAYNDIVMTTTMNTNDYPDSIRRVVFKWREELLNQNLLSD